MAVAINLIAGLIFGAGLILSGMINPAKVLNFLDVAGSWDPSLAFVMAGAIFVTSIGYAVLARRARPFFAEKFRWPEATAVDARLVIGSAIFGIGWGLVGLCPGPAITSVLLGAPAVYAFVPAMAAGVWFAARIWPWPREKR